MDFGKLPFPTHLGKYLIKIGKIRAKIHEIGKIKAIFGLGMTPMYGLKIGQIKSLVDFLFIVTPIVGVCNCSMFCCTLLYVHFSIAIILMGKRELIALLNLSSWSLVMVERLFLTVPQGCLQFVIVVFPDHTHLLFLGLYRLYLYWVNTAIQG